MRAGASPAFWARIVAACREQNRLLPDDLRTIYAGGAPVFPRLLDDLHAIAPSAVIVAVYGSTEAEPIAHLARSDLVPADVPAMREGRGLLAGCPVADLQLRILPDHWGTTIGPFDAATFSTLRWPAHEPGEIVVSGSLAAVFGDQVVPVLPDRPSVGGVARKGRVPFPAVGEQRQPADREGFDHRLLKPLAGRRGLGFRQVEQTSLLIQMEYSCFDDYWTPFTSGESPLGQLVASLSDNIRSALPDHLRNAYLSDRPDGLRSIPCVAWACRGTVLA